jgi:hypothetical protein
MAGANSPANAPPGMRLGLDLSGLESEREGGEDVADDGSCDVDEFVVEHDHLSNAREERMDLVVRGLGCGRGEDRDAVSHLARRTRCGAIDGPVGICVPHDFERRLGKSRHDDGRVKGDRSGDRGELSGLVAENDNIGIPGDRRVVRERLPAGLGRQFGSTSRVGSGAQHRLAPPSHQGRRRCSGSDNPDSHSPIVFRSPCATTNAAKRTRVQRSVIARFEVFRHADVGPLVDHQPPPAPGRHPHRVCLVASVSQVDRQTTGTDEEESPCPQLPTRLLSLETRFLRSASVQALIAKSA